MIERTSYTGFVTFIIGAMLYGIGILVNLDKDSGRPEVNFDFVSILLMISGVLIFIFGMIRRYRYKKFEKENK